MIALDIAKARILRGRVPLANDLESDYTPADNSMLDTEFDDRGRLPYNELLEFPKEYGVQVAVTAAFPTKPGILKKIMNT